MTAWHKGTCSAAGYTTQAGSSANATGQVDMFKCVFKSWDFKHTLPAELSKTQWANASKAGKSKVRS